MIKQIKKYRFQTAIEVPNTHGKIFPSFKADEIKNKAKLLDKSRNINIFLPRDTLFTPLIPEYYGEFPQKRVENLVDMHGWIREYLKGTRNIFSENFKEFIETFQLDESIFYPAEVRHEAKLLPYYIFHMKYRPYFNDWINYKHSTFSHHTSLGKQIEEESFQVENKEELIRLQEQKEWRNWGFSQAVMYPEFEQYDLINVKSNFRYLISKKLKNALEKTDFIGYKIKPEPIIFEIAEEGV